MFVVALPPKTFGVRFADYVCFDKCFPRTWQDLPTCHRHSFQGGLVVQSQFNAVHISVVFITTVVTHIFQLQNCVCGERRIWCRGTILCMCPVGCQQELFLHMSIVERMAHCSHRELQVQTRTETIIKRCNKTEAIRIIEIMKMWLALFVSFNYKITHEHDAVWARGLTNLNLWLRIPNYIIASFGLGLKTLENFLNFKKFS